MTDPAPSAVTDWCPVLLAERKAAARQMALAARAAVDPAGAAERLRDAVMHAGLLPSRPATIAGFWPMATEIDIRPLLQALEANGHALALPVTPKRGNPLRFRGWRFGAPLAAGPFGTRQPPPEAPEVMPDALLVPLLAFDRLARIRARRPVPAIGVGFACQEIARAPEEDHDQPLDFILTEKELIDFSLAWRAGEPQ